MLRVYTHLRRGNQTLIGPNCPGIISPGQASVGIMPTQVFNPGRVGLVSRSGTLTYQISKELALLGIGQSTVVGIGGDPIVGSSFIDIVGRFDKDPETDLIVMVGEIGGNEEEKAAAFIAEQVSTPVVSYIAGFQAPPGKQMGHAGAIITGSSAPRRARRKPSRPRACGSGPTRPRSRSSSRRRWPRGRRPAAGPAGRHSDGLPRPAAGGRRRVRADTEARSDGRPRVRDTPEGTTRRITDAPPGPARDPLADPPMKGSPWDLDTGTLPAASRARSRTRP